MVVMPRLSMLLICHLGLMASPSPLSDQEGTWATLSMERDGQLTPEEIVKTITRTVEGDHVVWKRDGKPFAGTSLKVNPDSDPKTIDVTPDGGAGRDKLALGIYRLEGDLLTICMADVGEARPKEFSAPKSSKRTLMVFRRSAAPPKSSKPKAS